MAVNEIDMERCSFLYAQRETVCLCFAVSVAYTN